MSKVRLKKPADSSQTNGPSKQRDKKNKRAWRKKQFFGKKAQKTAKKKAKPEKKDIFPKTDQEFSTNWKNLLQVLASDKTEGTKQKKDSNLKGKQPQKTATDSKYFHKPDKHTNKSKQNVKPPLEKTGRSEKDGNQQNGKGPTIHKQYKAEKRKRKEEKAEKNKPMDKKKKLKEVEIKTEKLDIWFDDVDPDDIEATVGPEAADIVRKRNGIMKSDTEITEKALVKEHSFEGLTRAVAMDCEMVGVGPDGEESILARISLCNIYGKCVYDKYVKPTEKVTDYRTAVSGIRPADIENGEDFRTVQKEVAQILKGRILVGHAIHNDLKILLLDHPKKMIRDTQKYKPFKQRVKSGRPALRVLCKEILNVQVQKGEHSSVQDAQATMRLYTMVRKQWEAELKASRTVGKQPKSPCVPKEPKTET
ncbi:RNA exonuclease 4 [Myxocyprinus asiaticus]|uniref:RNA exonuclease 4 n=1 Tax=Myxocyprinus asiaticus TaxID=70543 RepID=UPI00222350DF|nr:RNA exonuclease 4 [Myxocyprinus asiaticus]